MPAKFKTCLDCGARWRPTKGPRQRCTECSKKRDRGAQPARQALSNAVRRGELIRRPCEVCGDPKSEGHHDDYAKLLDVRWLCRTHHRQHHAAECRRIRDGASLGA